MDMPPDIENRASQQGSVRVGMLSLRRWTIVSSYTPFDISAFSSRDTTDHQDGWAVDGVQQCPRNLCPLFDVETLLDSVKLSVNTWTDE
eukprot:349494-Pyramimonas_sp.AAC.1